MNDTSKREEILLDLFLHKGWQMLMEEMREARTMLVETTHVLETERQLWHRKGEIQKLSELIAFEEITKMQVDEEMRSGDAL